MQAIATVGWIEYARRRALWLVALPIAVALGIVLHELSHAVAVLALGGEVIDLQLIPSIDGGRLTLGHVRQDGAANARLVAVAPTLVWLAVASATAALSARMRSRRRAALVTWLLVVAPLIDVSASIGGLVTAAPGADLWIALAGLEPIVNVVAAALFLVSGRVVYQRINADLPNVLAPATFAIGLGALLLAPWLLYVG